MDYNEWKLKVIEHIIQTTGMHPRLKMEEIKVVLRDDGDYPECFKDGDEPWEAWQAEVDAIKDSQ